MLISLVVELIAVFRSPVVGSSIPVMRFVANWRKPPLVESPMNDDKLLS